MRRPVHAALAATLVLASRTAAADYVEDPAVPATSEAVDAPRLSHTRWTLGAVGGYRRIFDLSLLEGGLALSVGSDKAQSAHLDLRGMAGRTLGGLSVIEVGATATCEWTVASPLRLGAGVGLATFTVARATNAASITSLGPEGLLRLGYDFAPRDAVYLAFDVSAALQTGGAVVWGPMLGGGYRF